MRSGWRPIPPRTPPKPDISCAAHRENEDYAIIYIEENLAAELEHEISKFKDRPTPAVILIPGREGSMGLGQSALKAAVERAVGTNILGD